MPINNRETAKSLDSIELRPRIRHPFRVHATLLPSPGDGGVEWRKSGWNMEHRYMELESIVEREREKKALLSRVLVPIRCSPRNSTAFATTRSARRLVNWSSLRPLQLRTLIKRGGQFSSSANGATNADKYPVIRGGGGARIRRFIQDLLRSLNDVRTARVFFSFGKVWIGRYCKLGIISIIIVVNNVKVWIKGVLEFVVDY